MSSVSGETADYETLPLKAENAAVRADLFSEGLLHNFELKKVLNIFDQSFAYLYGKHNSIMPNS
jgi:hypothetical protein